MTAVYHRADFFLTGNEKDFFNLYNQRIDRTLILKPYENIDRGVYYIVV